MEAARIIPGPILRRIAGSVRGGFVTSSAWKRYGSRTATWTCVGDIIESMLSRPGPNSSATPCISFRYGLFVTVRT